MPSRFDPLANWFEGIDGPSTELSLGDLEEILGFRLAKSYRQYPAAWVGGNPPDCAIKSAGWHAYPRLRRGTVMFRRIEAVPRESVSTDPVLAPLDTTDVILLGCVKTKRASSAPAKELYISPLWNKRRRYAEMSGKPWMILSAEHGLLDPDTVIEPYDVALAARDRNYCLEWSRRVYEELRRTFGSLTRKTFEIHAGAAYFERGLSDLLRETGAKVVRPLEDPKFGEQLAWYEDERWSDTATERTTAAEDGRAACIPTIYITNFFNTLLGRDTPPRLRSRSHIRFERDLTRSLPHCALGIEVQCV